MLTLKEMRKTAKEKRFKFDVSFVGWLLGERRYNLVIEKSAFYGITYNNLLCIYTWLNERYA